MIPVGLKMADDESKQIEKPDDSEENFKERGVENNKETVTDGWQAPVFISARSALGKLFSKSESVDNSEKPPEQERKKRKHRDPRTIERNNLLNVSKLIIKELIDSSMAHGRMLDDDHEPLQQFFIVLEHVLRHGLRPKKSILRDRRDFWCVLELVEKFVPEAAEITATVRDMPKLKTPLGKARAWLRLAAMQKTLADYFKVLIEKKDLVLSEFYEPGALIMEDEGTVIAGLLVGLNVIDCNLGIKDDDLDQPMGVIDFSVYLKDSRLTDETDTALQSAEAQEKLQTILDQKNYLEELNRHLNATVANLQQKLEMANTTNALMKEDLAISKNTILQLEEEKKVVETQRDTILNVHKQQIEKTEFSEESNGNSDVPKENQICDSSIEIIEVDDRALQKEKSEVRKNREAIETHIHRSDQEGNNDRLDERDTPAAVDGIINPNEVSTETDTADMKTKASGDDTEGHEAAMVPRPVNQDAPELDRITEVVNEEWNDENKHMNGSEPETRQKKGLRQVTPEKAEPETLISSTTQMISNIFKSKKKETKKDIDVERQTYLQSRAGLDDMYADVKKRLEEEIQLRLDIEKELELQICMKQEIEMALRLLEKDIHEKQDSIIGLRQQLEDVKNINLQMYNKLETCDSSLKHKTTMVTKLEEKTNQLVAVLKDMEKKLKQSESDKNAAEETARKLGQNLADKDAKRTALETDLRIEREWRGNLQKNLEHEKSKVSQLQTELQTLKHVQEEYTQLQRQHTELKHLFEDQEKALAELGSHLSESKLRVEDMKEVQLANREATWASDKEVTNCKQCEKPFSVARRKHHCRNCGEIFCAECSDNKMPHPSSAKPVRVCDTCQEILLQRYSATGK